MRVAVFMAVLVVEDAVEPRCAVRPAPGRVQDISLAKTRVPDSAAITARALELVDAFERSESDTVRPGRRAA